MTDSKQFYKLLGALAVFWVLVLVLFNRWQYSAGPVICAGYLILYLLGRDPETKFLILLSGLPFQAVTKLTSSLPSVSVLLCALYVAEALVRDGFRLRARFVLPALGLIVLQVLAALFFDASWRSILAILLMVLFAATACDRLTGSEDPETLLTRCAWVHTVFMLIDTYAVSVFPRLPYYILAHKQMLLDRVHRFCALNGDPNYYGQLVLVGVGFLAGLALQRARQKRWAGTGVYTALAVLLTMNGLRSVSKGFAFGLAALLLLLLWFGIMENRSARQKALLFVVFLAVGFVAARALATYVILPTISRRTNTDLLTGRVDIWKAYGQMLRSNPSILLFGAGFGNSQPFVSHYTGASIAAHNLFIEAFCDLGMMGLALVALMWVNAGRLLRALMRDSRMLFFWGLLLTSAGLSASANDVLYFAVPICVLVLGAEDRMRSEVPA